MNPHNTASTGDSVEEKWKSFGILVTVMQQSEKSRGFPPLRNSILIHPWTLQ